MIIDMHIHSKSSDGKLPVAEVLTEAKNRNIAFMSITDHDTISCQREAIKLARAAGIRYITGVELNVTFSHPHYRQGKPTSLDFLGYNFNPCDSALEKKTQLMAKYREERAAKILQNINLEFSKESIPALTAQDFVEIESSVDGVMGRPHIADYLVKKKIVTSRQEAFDKYLVKCDVPKYPILLQEASKLVRDAGGKLILAHPNDPNGTSLFSLTKVLSEQTAIVEELMMPFIDGVECWHSRSDEQTTKHYLTFANMHSLIKTGGSDCHQKPILMGTVNVPDYVTTQF